MNLTERTAQLLDEGPKTRHELERALGVSQQRVSEILRSIGAKVVAKRRDPGMGRSAPVYGNCAPKKDAEITRPVSSVFDLAGALK